ncbi:MAG: MFS transporter [Gammaproteobacteria bacterium]
MSAPADAAVQASAATRTAAHFTLGLLFVISLFNYTDRYMIAILLPSIKQDFGLSDTQMGVLTGIAFTLFYVVLGVPIARLADQTSRKKILVIALALWSVMTAACGMAQTFIQLLIARMLVGIGEAGSSPPSYSAIADLYPKHRRATAMAVYLAGAPAGILIGFILGGWLAEQYGWRYALLAVGIPGALFAVVLIWLFKEPLRGESDGVQQTRAVPFMEGVKALLSNRTFRHAAMGSAFYNALAVTYVNWMPSFFVRSHGMGVSETGVTLALIFGPAQIVGLLAGGHFSDRLARFDVRWYLRVPAIVMLLAAPFFMLCLGVQSTGLALTCLAIPLLVGGMQVSPIFAITPSLVDVRMRAVASAVLILIINLISGGVGPVVVGMLSDLLAPGHGVDSLRYALLIVTPVFSLWAALHYYLGSRRILADIRERPQ